MSPKIGLGLVVGFRLVPQHKNIESPVHSATEVYLKFKETVSKGAASLFFYLSIKYTQGFGITLNKNTNKLVWQTGFGNVHLCNDKTVK